MAATRTPYFKQWRDWSRQACLGFREGGDPKVVLQKHYTDLLHQSVDGRELRMSAQERSSSSWVDLFFTGIPGRDYVQHHRTRINALPSRVRNSRGRREESDVSCRAGCRVQETTAHCIQSCWRTHGGRILRHNAVAATLGSALEDKGWTVTKEPLIDTGQGLRKPDIVAARGEDVAVVDVQVVGGPGLSSAHRNKKEKYESNSGVWGWLRKNYPQDSRIKFTTCTISWRGVWCGVSARELRAMGVSAGTLRGLTTRVLQGSHTNWTRFNQMCTIKRHERGVT